MNPNGVMNGYKSQSRCVRNVGLCDGGGARDYSRGPTSSWKLLRDRDIVIFSFSTTHTISKTVQQSIPDNLAVSTLQSQLARGTGSSGYRNGNSLDENFIGRIPEI